MKIEEAIQKSWGELWEAASIGIWNSYVKANQKPAVYYCWLYFFRPYSLNGMLKECSKSLVK